VRGGTEQWKERRMRREIAEERAEEGRDKA